MSSKTEKKGAPPLEAAQDPALAEAAAEDKNAIPLPDLPSETDDSSQEPLFSSLLPNLGTGLVSLSKPRAGLTPPVSLPPPKAQQEKERPAKAAPSATKSAAGEIPAPPARGGKGVSCNGKSVRTTPEGDYAVLSVGSGHYVFKSRVR